MFSILVLKGCTKATWFTIYYAVISEFAALSRLLLILSSIQCVPLQLLHFLLPIFGRRARPHKRIGREGGVLFPFYSSSHSRRYNYNSLGDPFFHHGGIEKK